MMNMNAAMQEPKGKRREQRHFDNKAIEAKSLTKVGNEQKAARDCAQCDQDSDQIARTQGTHP
jgi:hypothetical protein